MTKPAKSAPWLPPKYDIKIVAAIQALMRGDASQGQQQLALGWIIEVGAAAYDMSYRPDSARDSDFAEGRRFVGMQIVKLTKLNLELMKKMEKPNG